MSLTEEQKKISDKILFGEEDPKTVIQEITEGTRPPHWNTPGHPDHQIWCQIQAEKTPLFDTI
jgi:hypothetical protein